MIDPIHITNYNLTDDQLEEHILFWVCAAGKNGVTAARGLNDFLTRGKIKYGSKDSPFEIIRQITDSDLSNQLKISGIGCYNIKAKTFKKLSISRLDLKTCTVNDLESIKGIGPKTARCFLIHSRPNQRLAGLDRHILSYLKDKGYQVPQSTPTKNKYKQIEQWFLQEADKQQIDVAVLDLRVWNEYRNKQGKK